MARILIADHNSTSRRMTAYILRRHGYGVAAEPDTPGALRRLAAGEADLLIADIDLLPADAAAMIGQLRAHEPAPPILITSSGWHVQDRAQALAAGADAFLARPCSSLQLLAAVEQLLAARAAAVPLELAVGAPRPHAH